MDPVVSSHTRLCGHFTGCTIKKNKTNQTTNRGWKEETDEHGFRTANVGRWSWHFFSILCMFMAIARTLRKSYTDADSSGHRLHGSTSCFWLHCPVSWAWIIWLTASESHSKLTDLESHSWVTTSIVLLFQFRRFSRAQLFVLSSHQNRQRKVFQTLRRHFKDTRDNPTGHPQHTEPPPTCIYTPECSLSCHISWIDSFCDQVDGSCERDPSPVQQSCIPINNTQSLTPDFSLEYMRFRLSEKKTAFIVWIPQK